MERRNALYLAAAVLILSISGLLTYHFPTYTQAFYSYVGRSIVEGKLPYRDVWDNKLPSIHYVNALWHLGFGTNYFGHRIAEVAILAATVILFALFVRRERAANWGAATLVFALLLSLPDIGQWNYTEPYALLFIMLAFVAMQRNAPIASGVAIGIAATFWIPSSLLLPAMLVYERERGRAGAFVRIITGFFGVTALYWATIAAAFGLEKIVALLGDMRSYEEQKWSTSVPMWIAARGHLADTLLRTGLLIPFVVLLALARFPRTGGERFALAWLACSLAGAAVNLNFSDHYFVPSTAPLAYALTTFASAARLSPVRSIFCAALAIALLSYGPKMWSMMHRSYVGQYETAHDAALAGRVLAASLPREAPILVCASDQGIYLQANRDAAGRFAFMSGIEQTPMNRRAPRLREYVEDMQRAAAVVADPAEPVPTPIAEVLRNEFVRIGREDSSAYRHYRYAIYLNRRTAALGATPSAR